MTDEQLNKAVWCDVLADWCWTEEPRHSLSETSPAERPRLHCESHFLFLVRTFHYITVLCRFVSVISVTAVVIFAIRFSSDCCQLSFFPESDHVRQSDKRNAAVSISCHCCYCDRTLLTRQSKVWAADAMNSSHCVCQSAVGWQMRLLLLLAKDASNSSIVHFTWICNGN